jgi:hypothetical protein
VRNAGRKSWKGHEGFALSYHWFNPQRRLLDDGPRTPLPRTLEGGQEALLQPLVVAPAEVGCYLLVWDMVHEHSTWFSGQGVRPAAVPALVGEGDPMSCAAASPPASSLAWQPSRRELWALARAMWAGHPWTGVGPDNFRRLYGAYAGQAFWDDRVSANSLLLEVGATTGWAGVLTLAATLAATAWSGGARARRGPSPAARAEGAAVLGLTVAVIVHGAVDYLLGFTGPYLLLSFLVGTAAAPPEAEEGAPAAAGGVP